MTGMQQVITNLVPALSFSVKSGLESPKTLPYSRQKGGRGVCDRPNHQMMPVQTNRDFSLALGKRTVVKSVSLRMCRYRERDHGRSVDRPKPCRETIRCFACSGLGHIAKHCSKYNAHGIGSQVRCFRCGNKGHNARNCPCASTCNVSSDGIQVTNHGVGSSQFGHKGVTSKRHMPHQVLRGQNGQARLGNI